MAAFRDSIDFAGDSDLFSFNLIGGIDYVATALGASNLAGTLRDPAIQVFDSNFNLIAQGNNSFALGSDPLVQFKAPGNGTYHFQVFAADGGTGTYEFVADQAGVPVFFGGTDSFNTFN